MKFKNKNGVELKNSALEGDFSTALDGGKVRLGELGAYFQKLMWVEHLPYEEIIQAYLRQEEVKAKLCCGIANMDQFYLVLVDNGGNQHAGLLDNREKGDALLKKLGTQQCQVSIGFWKDK